MSRNNCGRTETVMKKVISVKFKLNGKSYYFSAPPFNIKQGDDVIVETSRGIELGRVSHGVQELEDSAIPAELKSVLRLATKEDITRNSMNKQKEKDAFEICQKKIKEHNLEMKLVEVEYTFDGSKILFYFTADGRVDFRDLVKDLAAIFRTRIELRQIGVRDESKTLGSIGVCGRSLCCSQWLDDFTSVSIKMAKEQGLSLNPTKISGACGRLMCCLKYEQDTYESLIKEMPKAEQKVKTPDGIGTVVSVNLLRGIIKVEFDKDGEKTLCDYKASEVSEVRNSSRRKNKEQILKEIDEFS